MKGRMKLLAGLFVSTTLCIGLGVSTLFVSAETYGDTVESWIVNEHATDLTVSNVSAGGVGTITYTTVPEEDRKTNGTAENECFYNSVTIPVTDYDVKNTYLSIKYNADFDATGAGPSGDGHAITIWMNYAAGVDETTGEEYEAGFVLAGWFVNWNVTSGKAIDGNPYITVLTGEYTKGKTVTGVTLNFGYVGDATVAKTFNLMGLTFHEQGVTPTFATDPEDPIIDAPISGGSTENAVKIGEWTDIGSDGSHEAGNMTFEKDANGKTVINFPAVPTHKSRINAVVEGHDPAKLPKVKITYSSTKEFAFYFALNNTTANTELCNYEKMEAGENKTVTYDLIGKTDGAPLTANKIYISIDRVGYGAYDASTYEDGTGKTITLDIQFVDADGNVPSAEGGIEVNGTKEIPCAVHNWDTEYADRVVAKIAGFDGMGLTVKVGEETAYETTFTGSAEQTIEADLSKYSELTEVTFVLTGNGTAYINEVILSKTPAVSAYTTSLADYFSTYEEINEGTYQMHMARKPEGGFVNVNVNVSNYIDTYDILAVDVEVLSGKALLGLMVGKPDDGKYLINHWDAANFLDVGKYQFTFLDFNLINENWDNKLITLFVNPSAATTEGYTFEADIKIGMYFLKSSELAEGSVSFAEQSYSADYTGQPITVAQATDPNNAGVTYKFAIDGKEYNAVSNVGTYTVTATTNCTRTHLPATATTTLTINKVKAAVPEITAVAEGNTVNFSTTQGIEYKMNEEDEWATLDTFYDLDLEYDTEYTITVRVADSNNVFASDATTLTFRTEKEKVAKPSITATAEGNTIKFSATEGIEYKLSADGEWKDLATLTDLKYATEYTIIVRAKATNDKLASDEVTLKVTTGKANAAKPTVTATAEGNTIKFSATEGLEYKLGADGTWKDLATITDLEYNKEYSVIVRAKETATTLASEEVTLKVTTGEAPAEQPPKEEPVEKGCCSSIGAVSALALLPVCVVAIWLCKKKKKD